MEETGKHISMPGVDSGADGLFSDHDGQLRERQQVQRAAHQGIRHCYQQDSRASPAVKTATWAHVTAREDYSLGLCDGRRMMFNHPMMTNYDSCYMFGSPAPRWDLGPLASFP